MADELWAAADVRFASRLVYPEARAALAATGRVRGYDAVHLATALASSGSELVMVTWDRELALAALACGHPVAPPL